MHTTHHDDLGIRFGSLACQCQGVADEVGHLLNLTLRIVVGENHRILFLADCSYFFFQIYFFAHGFVDESLFEPFVFQHHILFILFFIFLFKREMIGMIGR